MGGAIDFLLRFFHQKQVNGELFKYAHMFIKASHLSNAAAFSHLFGDDFAVILLTLPCVK